MNLEQWSVGGRGFGTIFVFLLMAGEIYTTFTFWEEVAGRIAKEHLPFIF